jgi:transposase InsO family protein
MEKLFLDFVGPLPRTRKGNVAILVVVDSFSKFVWFFSVKRIASSVAIECLENTYFPSFGSPTTLVADNAKVFRSRAFKDLCFRSCVQHVTTTPYYPQSSLAERVIRNLKSALKIHHALSQDNWDVDLPWFATALNIAVHDSSNLTLISCF